MRSVKIRSVCRKCGVWKMRSVENAEEICRNMKKKYVEIFVVICLSLNLKSYRISLRPAAARCKNYCNY